MTNKIEVDARSLERVVRVEMRSLDRRIRNAVESALRKTSRDAIGIIRPRTPKAFGELVDSLHAEDGDGDRIAAKTVLDAPHASAVEKGSLPHHPDYEALLAWVKLRGMQGLAEGGRIRRRFGRSEGPTTPTHAVSVAMEIRSREMRGSRAVGRHVPIDVPDEIARRIYWAIVKNGTRPQFFVRDSLPQIESKLGDNVRRALDLISGK